MSKNKKPLEEQNNISLKAQAIEQKFSGPIPPPSFLQAYEVIVPGSANRILSMAEQNSTHSIAMDREQVALANRQIDSQATGRRYALYCFFGVIGVTFYAIYKGQSIVALGALIAEMVTLAGVFIVGRFFRKK